MAALPRSRKLLCSGREETPDRKKPRCGTGSWYPPLCLQHLEKQRNGAASVCSGSGNGGPARHHVTIGIKYTAKKSSTPHGYFFRFGPSTFKLNDPPRR